MKLIMKKKKERLKLAKPASLGDGIGAIFFGMVVFLIMTIGYLKNPKKFFKEGSIEPDNRGGNYEIKSSKFLSN